MQGIETRVGPPEPRRRSVPATRLAVPAAVRPPTRAWTVLLPLWLLVFTTVGQLLVMAPLLPRIGEETGAGAGVLGTLFTAEALMVAAFALVIGPVSDRIGRRRVLLLGSGLLTLALAAHGLVAATLRRAPRRPRADWRRRRAC
jgi:cyanate permease